MCSFIVCIMLMFTVVSASEKSNLDSVSYFSKDFLQPSFLRDHLTFVHTCKSGKKVYVFDGVFPYSLLMTVRGFFSANNNWRYVLFDKYVTDSTAKFDDENGIPWKSWQNPTVLSETRLGYILKAMVAFASSNATNADNRNFHLTEIYSAILRRGDATNLHQDSSNVREGFSAVMYTNTIWRKNSYGEILFYEDENDYDIFAVASPRCGRVVIWDSSIRYITRPPSITELSGQYMIFAQFHSNPKIIYEKRSHFDIYLDDLKAIDHKDFVCTDNVERVPKLDLQQHLFLKKQNTRGHVVAVFDNLFTKNDLDALRTYTVKYGKYYYDDHLDMSSDNVQWIAALNIKKFVSSRFWPVVRQVASYVSGKKDWYPYDIACNLLRSADHTRFHLDTSSDEEEELTFLLYLNPNWTAALYGETAFMEKNFDSPDNDYVAEVVPKYGRAVIFDGNFPHSGHPPAPDYHGPRYTFVVKLSVNKSEAIRKAFSQEKEHVPVYVKEMLRKMEKDPETFSKMHKIDVVNNYLQTREIKLALDSKPKTPEGLLQEPAARSENDGLAFLDLDSQSPLGDESRQLLGEMVVHHGLNSSERDLEEDEDDLNSDTFMLYTVEERIRSWMQKCMEDGDCLEAYFELFLKQRSELSRRVIRDMLVYI